MTHWILTFCRPALFGDVPAAHQLPHTSLRFPFGSETQGVGAPFSVNQNFNFE